MSREVKKGNSPGLPKSPGDVQRPPANETDVARQEALSEEIMRDDREVLRKLAE
ncbi:MAG: hypothetical protein OXI75_14535 [Rhodospirillales bacterium]|nr:hypothetical protein [Rhodospirillales bacterium]